MKLLDIDTEFLRRFPVAPETSEAQKDVTEINRLLAEKELYVGDFYFKREFFDSAKTRYKKVIELFPESDTAKKAKEKLEIIEARPKSNDEP